MKFDFLSICNKKNKEKRKFFFIVNKTNKQTKQQFYKYNTTHYMNHDSEQSKIPFRIKNDDDNECIRKKTIIIITN